MDQESRRRLLAGTVLVGFSLALTLGLCAAVAAFVGRGHPGEHPAVDEYLARTGHRCLDHIPELDHVPTPTWAEGWERLTDEDCRPGSWLNQFREEGQNLARYQAGQPNRVTRDQPILLRPLGRIERPESARLIEPVREFVSLYFQLDTALEDGLELPRAALDPARGDEGQYDADVVLEALEGTCPEGAGACLAVTDRDLYVPDLQYVFGLGHFRKRVGVFSTYRVGKPRRNAVTGEREAVRDPEPLRRALKIAVHELGHELSLAHCVHYRRCVMAGTNSMNESDAGRLTLCPLDHEKLRWNLGFDPYRRFKDLARFAHRHGLHPEARYWERMARSYPGAANAAGAGGL
jgi:archaemetzincin